MPVLSIIIPTKDRPGILNETIIRANKAVKNYDVEILVINDSTESLSDDIVKYSKVKVYHNSGKGVATARNFGANNAKSDLLLFLDDDMWISEENIQAYLEFNKTHLNSILNLNWVYPEYLENKLNEFALGRYLKSINFNTMKGWNIGNAWDDNNLFESSGVAGANLFMHKKIYNQLGGYDATFPFAGFEDYDMSHRIKEAGYKCFINPNSIMFHNEANKLELRAWLKKNYNSAITNKHAVNIGYEILRPKRSLVKRLFYFLLIPFSGLLITFSNCLSKYQKYDSINFKLIPLLTGMYMYKGYNNL